MNRSNSELKSIEYENIMYFIKQLCLKNLYKKAEVDFNNKFDDSIKRNVCIVDMYYHIPNIIRRRFRLNLSYCDRQEIDSTIKELETLYLIKR